MVDAEELSEYAANIRALLRTKPGLFAPAVDRQVRFALLPKLQGNRAALEHHLWNLLILCLDGPDASVPELDAAVWEQAAAAAADGQRRDGQGTAAHARAAAALKDALETLREHGVYPAPKMAQAPDAGPAARP